MPLIARQRSRLAVLAVVALVGSLLAVSAVPVAAEHQEPRYDAKHTACIGPATEESPGFTDTVGNTHEHAIDCLAYYGITTGKTPSTYDPNTAITRSQMALFLHRAAAPAGVNLPTTVTDQGLIDISGHAQDEINQIVQLGIMEPRTNMTFNPNDHVTRADMAQHLHAFLGLATPGPGAYGGNAGMTADEVEENLDKNPFTDINNETKNAYDAILFIYELGITEGQTHTTYNPTGPVTRAQMASFITRTMDHTNTRPTGITAQGVPAGTFVGDTGLSAWISLRDTKFLPIEEALVDSFYYLVDEDNAPFVDEGDDKGKCRIDNPDTADTNEGPVQDGCTLGDDITEEGGNFKWPLPEVSTDHGEVMVYFWTGQEGDFNQNKSEHYKIAITVSKAAEALKIETTHGDTGDPTAAEVLISSVDEDSYEYQGEYAKYGETATVTIQLVDDADNAGNPTKDSKPVADKNVEVKVRVQKSDGAGNTEDSTSTHKTDEDGKIQLTYTKNDPNPDADNTGTVIVTVSYMDDVGSADRSSAPIAGITTIQWTDAEAEATTIKLSSTRNYVKLPADEGEEARVTISSRVYDQYGDPIKQAVTLMSTGGGTHSAKARSLGFHVTYRVDVPADETGNAQRFGAWFGEPGTPSFVGTDVTNADPPNVVDESSENGQTVYWAEKQGSASGETIAHVDEDERTIVVSSATQTGYAVYDSDDQFTFEDNPVLMSKFEEELDKGDTITWTINEGVSTFDLNPTG